jgi:hypothetical protein
MTAKDRWEMNLACPVCGAVGTADVFQYDGWSFSSDSRTHVSSVSDGFRIQATKSEREQVKVFCEKCEVQVK